MRPNGNDINGSRSEGSGRIKTVTIAIQINGFFSYRQDLPAISLHIQKWNTIGNVPTTLVKIILKNHLARGIKTHPKYPHRYHHRQPQAVFVRRNRNARIKQWMHHILTPKIYWIINYL